MTYLPLGILGAYFSPTTPLSVMDDFGNLVNLGHTEAAPLAQWEYSVAERN